MQGRNTILYHATWLLNNLKLFKPCRFASESRATRPLGKHLASDFFGFHRYPAWPQQQQPWWRKPWLQFLQLRCKFHMFFLVNIGLGRACWGPMRTQCGEGPKWQESVQEGAEVDCGWIESVHLCSSYEVTFSQKSASMPTLNQWCSMMPNDCAAVSENVLRNSHPGSWGLSPWPFGRLRYQPTNLRSEVPVVVRSPHYLCLYMSVRIPIYLVIYLST